MKRHLWIVVGTVLVCFSLACQSVPFLAHPTATPTTTPTPTKTSTPTKTPTPTKTYTPTGILGITMPVTVNGVKIKFTALHQESEMVFGTSRYTPKLASDIFIVAEADVLTSGTPHSKVADWDVTMNQNKKWVFVQSHGDTNSITSVEWVFILSKTTTKFEINLPGGVDVVLNSLMR
jgi:hypothetical protein